MDENKIPEGVELPNPENSIEHKDVAPIEDFTYERSEDGNTERCA